MTKATPHLLLALVVIFAAAYEASAQTSKPAEPSFQELVKEVRLLRGEVRRFGIVAFKTQIMIEQTEVARLVRGVSDVRGQLEEIRSKQQKTRELLREIEKDVDSGVRSPKDLKAMTADLASLAQNEQRLTETEAQMGNELMEARAKLADLEKQLNAIDHDTLAPE
jgi:chromosome segregation ATPase